MRPFFHKFQFISRFRQFYILCHFFRIFFNFCSPNYLTYMSRSKYCSLSENDDEIHHIIYALLIVLLIFLWKFLFLVLLKRTLIHYLFLLFFYGRQLNYNLVKFIKFLDREFSFIFICIKFVKLFLVVFLFVLQ